MRQFIMTLCALCCTFLAYSQQNYFGETVYQGPDITFRVIDGHTWHGYGKLVYNETVFVIEGEDKVLVIDAGTRIAELPKIIASLSPSLSSKPMVLALTHLHGDHSGSAIHDFDELWYYPVNDAIRDQYLSQYKGKINFLRDGTKFDLGGRTITVFHTPGHTEGSVTFVDFANKYGFSGDSFGSTNLLLGTTVPGFRASCIKMLDIMTRNGITHLYPGHTDGSYCETQKTIKNEIQMCDDIMSGKKRGKSSGENGVVGGSSLTLTVNGQSIVYSENGCW